MAFPPNRLRELREQRGKSQQQVAEAIGTTQNQISRLESGERELTIGWMNKLGAALSIDPAEILQAPKRRRAEGFASIPVIGHVQAGEWREAMQWDRDDWYSIEVPHDPRYPRIERFALEIRGDSMNLLYPDRSTIIVSRYIDLERNPAHKDRVVVIRRNRDGAVEATVKELIVEADGTLWLWPRSVSPQHQQPIPLPWREKDWERHLGDGESRPPKRARADSQGITDGVEEIVVLAKVTSSYRTE